MIVKSIDLTSDEIEILKELLERKQEITVALVEALTIEGLLEKLD